jgi:hypothetical protein
VKAKSPPATAGHRTRSIACASSKSSFAEAETRGGATLTDMQNLLGADFEVDAPPGSPRMLGSLIGYVMSVQSVVFKLQSGLVSLSVGEAPTGWGPYINHDINWSGDALKVIDLAKQKFSEVTAHYASGEALKAYRHFQQGYLTDFQCGPLEDVRAHIAKASAYASEDSSLKFVEGALALEARDAETAYRHLIESGRA